MILNLSDVLSEQHKAIHQSVPIEMTCFRSEMGNYVITDKTPLELSVEYAGDRKLEVTGKAEIISSAPCDRCLDDMEIPIDTHNRLVVKFGKEYAEESDEVVVIPEDEGAINLAWFLYEFIALAIPMKHVHAPGKCNKTMSSKLKKHTARSTEDGDEEYEDDSVEEDITIDDDVPVATDPRWDGLKGLLENDNN